MSGPGPGMDVFDEEGKSIKENIRFVTALPNDQIRKDNQRFDKE